MNVEHIRETANALDACSSHDDMGLSIALSQGAERLRECADLLASQSRALEEAQRHDQCHDLVCNGDRRYPRGEAGHGCSCATRAQRESAQLTAAQGEIARLKAERQVVFRRATPTPQVDPELEREWLESGEYAAIQRAEQAEAARERLLEAISVFQRDRGRHGGSHDTAGIHCRQCWEAYVRAESQFDAALATPVRPTEDQ